MLQNNNLPIFEKPPPPPFAADTLNQINANLEEFKKVGLSIEEVCKLFEISSSTSARILSIDNDGDEFAIYTSKGSIRGPIPQSKQVQAEKAVITQPIEGPEKLHSFFHRIFSFLIR